MPRASAVQYDDIAAACTSLAVRDVAVTFQNVYGELGRRGSGAIVHAGIRQWHRELAQRAAVAGRGDVAGVPHELVESADRMLQSLWKSGLTAASAIFDEEREALARQVNAVEEQLAAAAERNEQYELRQTQLVGELASRSDALAAEQRAHRATADRLTRLEGEAAALRAELARAQGALQDERARADAGVVWQSRAEAAERLLASANPVPVTRKKPAPRKSR